MVYNLLCFGSKKSKAQKMAEKNSVEDRASRDREMSHGDATYRQYEGPVEESPFYKNLKRTKLESTSRAYEQGFRSQRAKANMAGFGYEQPAVIGSDTALTAEEAAELAQAAPEAFLEASDRQMDVAGRRDARAGMYSGDSMQYFNQDARMEEDRRRRRAGLFRALTRTGLEGLSHVPKVGEVAGSMGRRV